MNSNVKSIIKKYTNKYPVDICSLIKECWNEKIVFVYKNLDENKSGEIREYNKSRPCLIINKNYSKSRQRFVLAKMFADYVLYNKIIKNNNIIYDNMNMIEKYCSIEKKVKSNMLAMEILIPIQHVVSLSKMGWSLIRIADELQVTAIALQVRLGIVGNDIRDDLKKLSSSINKNNV